MRFIMIAALTLAMHLHAEPKIQVSPMDLDLGQPGKNTRHYEFAYEITNVGDEELKISKVRTSCGCIASQPSKSKLAPGEKTTLAGTINTTGFEGMIKKSIYLYSNDPKQSTLTLNLRIHLPFNQAGPRLYPAAREGKTWGRVIKDGVIAVLFVENCNPVGDIAITQVDLPQGWQVRTPLPSSIKPTERASLTCFGPAERDAATSTISIPFTILTDDPTCKELKGTIQYRSPPKPPTP